MAKKSRNRNNSPADLAATAEVNENQEEVSTEVVQTPEVDNTPVVLDSPVIEEPAAVQAELKAAEAAKPVVAAKEAVDLKVRQLTSMIAAYKEVCNVRIPSPAQLLQMTTIFHQIMTFVLSNPTKPVLEAIYSFFINEHLGLMSEQRVFRSIHNNPIAQSKLEAFYTSFKALIEAKRSGKEFKISLESVRNVLGNDAFINFIASKL